MAMARPGNDSSIKTLFVVDDQPVIHLGLAAMLSDQPRLRLIGAARTFEQASQSIGRQPPDLFIVGLWFADHTGLGIIHRLHDRWPNTPVLVLGCYDEMIFAERALHAGARGFVMSNASRESILAAIKKVLAGEIHVSQAVAAHIVQLSVDGRSSDGKLSRLSDRELEVYELIARCRSVKEIAEMLHRSVKTIETHREHIKLKLGINSSRELSQHAAQWLVGAESTLVT